METAGNEHLPLVKSQY